MLSPINNKIASFEHKPRVFHFIPLLLLKKLSHIQMCQSALHHPVLGHLESKHFLLSHWHILINKRCYNDHVFKNNFIILMHEISVFGVTTFFMQNSRYPFWNVCLQCLKKFHWKVVPCILQCSP